MMKYKKSVVASQNYLVWADIEAGEYKYPRIKSMKDVLRVTHVESTPKVWREFIFLLIAIALNELNYR